MALEIEGKTGKADRKKKRKSQKKKNQPPAKDQMHIIQ